MDLINYLNENYYTKQQLIDLANISETELSSFQEQKVMPTCSYKLALSYSCESVFGEFNSQNEIEYYAKGYLSWIETIKVTADLQNVFSIFSQRYTTSLSELKNAGFKSDDPKINSKLDLHIEEEWGHFLNGVYGLCTKSGLPEDIAGKELAALLINEILEQKNDFIDLEQLTKVTNLLDKSSSMFAPHERPRSSRYRLIDEVRRKYKLKS